MCKDLKDLQGLVQNGDTLPIFHLLGPLRLGQGEPATISSPTVRALLAALLLQKGQHISRDRLIETIWERPPNSARANLRQHITHLRRLFETITPERSSHLRIIRGDRGKSGAYQLSLEANDFDLMNFEDLVKKGRATLESGHSFTAAALLDSALSLWQGSSCGINVNGSLYLQSQLDALNIMRDDVQELLLETKSSYVSPKILLSDVRAFAAEHPFRERAQLLLVHCLYAAGDTSGALRAYEQNRIKLSNELGHDPGPALQNLLVNILQHNNEAARLPIPHY
ncbi:BTAD domain-containing putative transcriptional regulator [Streptosporangium amethystogenes]|uniref:AfsR/SARP family transcriptional regulator n=1 Tax=Streptosporangium amethystogenes TaxID=2002 RepID=UPI0037ABE610